MDILKAYLNSLIIQQNYASLGIIFDLHRYYVQVLPSISEVTKTWLEECWKDLKNQMSYVRARVELDNLKRRRCDWVQLNAEYVPDLSQLSEEQLLESTYRTYQIKLV